LGIFVVAKKSWGSFTQANSQSAFTLLATRLKSGAKALPVLSI
jgi:hypothetical protein